MSQEQTTFSPKLVDMLTRGYEAGIGPPGDTDNAARERHMKGRGLLDVTWNGCSPYRQHATHVEFSLATQCGGRLLFRTPRADAEALHQVLGEALYGPPAGVQPSSVSGIPSVAGSPHDGHTHSPLASAYAASEGER